MDVVGVGENSVDLMASVRRMPPPDGKAPLDSLTPLPGGQVATALVGCARLGLTTRYVGTFGADGHGEAIREALEREGVDTAACLIRPCANRTAVILVDQSTGTRTVLWRRDPALDWAPGELPVAAITNARLLLVDATDLEGAIAAASAARAAGVTTVADVDTDLPGLDRLLRQIDILVVPEGFSADLRALYRDSGAAVVVATLGADGAVAWDGTLEHYAPGFIVDVVDTTGAGDAFRAGLITSLLDLGTSGLRDLGTSGLRDFGTSGLRDFGTVLSFANAVAALTCRATGAQAGLPDRAAVEALVTGGGSHRSNGAWRREHRASRRPAGWRPGEGG